MKIIVGSLNPQKVNAVQDLVLIYPMFAGVIVEGMNVSFH